MDKKVINEEQFKKLVIKEAGKIISESKGDVQKNSRKVTFDSVENLIKEMETSNKSISSINLIDELYTEKEGVISEVNKPNRDLDVNKHNKNKNVKHINEGEKDKWSRMMNYKVPKDEER